MEIPTAAHATISAIGGRSLSDSGASGVGRPPVVIVAVGSTSPSVCVNVPCTLANGKRCVVSGDGGVEVGATGRPVCQ